MWPISVAARSKAQSAAAHMVGQRVRIPPERRYVSLVSVVFCQVEVYASGRSLVQRSRTQCFLSECERKAAAMRRPWSTRGLSRREKKCSVCVLYGSGNKSDRVFPYTYVMVWFCNRDGMCFLRGTKLFKCKRNFVCRSTGTRFSQGTSVFACQHHCTNLRISLHLRAALTRRLNRQILGTLDN